MRVRFLLGLLWAGCGAPIAAVDSGLPDDSQPDAGTTDAGVPDAGAFDAGAFDAGVVDAGGVDAGVDAGVTDAGPGDAGTQDAGGLDAGAFDAGVPDAGIADAGPSCSRCLNYGSESNVGTVATTALNEISGLAASHVHPNVVYAHNDSGGLPVIYVISPTGASLAQLQLANAVNLDWEDLSVGPCPAGSCVYVADIGDNGNNRATPYYLYRIAEPATVPSGNLSVAWERIELQYPAGMTTDAETMMVHPITGDVYVVTKKTVGLKSAVYKASAPLSSATPAVMTKVADLAVPDGTDLPLTGGDIDPCGTSVLLRSYSAIYQFSGTGSFDALFTGAFTRVPSPPLSLGASAELQGEAITWMPGGGYLTVSEGAGQTLHRVSCQ